MENNFDLRKTNGCRFTIRRRMRWIYLAAGAAVLPALPALGQTNNWVNGTGNWNTAGNWSNGVPGNGEDVNIVDADGVGRTITYDYPGPAVTLNSLTLSLTGGDGVASETLAISGNTLSATTENIGGYLGSTGNEVGTVNQSGGLNAVGTGGMNLGYNSNDQGSYDLSGGAQTVNANVNVGYNGMGVFNQTGGTNTLTGGYSDIIVGSGAGSAGTYNLSGNSVLSADGEYVGQGGVGFFNQSGGTNTIGSDNFGLGFSAGSTGTYTLSGNGSLSGANFVEVIGYIGTGNFIQVGGKNTTNYIVLGDYMSASVGTYALSGTGTLSVSNEEDIGYDGTGTFTQSGGTNKTGTLDLGVDSGSSGTYTLTSGSLVATTLNIGQRGSTGNFNWTGGTLAIKTVNQSSGSFTDPNNLVIGSGGNVTTYNLSGGTLSVGSAIASFGSFTWSGGAIDITNSDFTIGPNGLFTNIVSITAGKTLSVTGSANTLNIVGLGLLAISGGTVNASKISNSAQLILGSGVLNLTNSDFVVGTGGLLGSNLILNSGQTIGVTGSSHTFAIANGATLNLDGGIINAATFTNSGQFFWASGALNLTNSNLTLGNGGLLGSTVTLVSGQTLGVTGSSNTLNITSNGTLNLGGGNLNAASLTNAGQLNWTGGTLNLTNSDLTIGTGGLLGSNLTVSSGMTLGVTGQNNTLTVANTGMLNLDGGAVIAANLNFQNNTNLFNWTNGSLSLSSESVIIDSTPATNFGGSAFTLQNNQALTVSATEYVGYIGMGAFNHNAGPNTTSTLVLGNAANATGTYNLGGTGALVANGTNNNEYVGYGGTGVFNQTGGTNTANALTLADLPGSTGTYVLSNTANLVVSGFYDNEYVGYGGKGTFAQTGGVNQVGTLYLGYNAGSTGTYILSGTGLLTGANSVEYVGGGGVGNFIQTGGSNSASSLLLGLQIGSSGTYSLSGSGVLSVSNEQIGWNGPGTFNQSGGTNLDGSTFYVDMAGSSTQSGGALSAPGEGIGFDEVGTFNQTGGTNTISGYLLDGQLIGSAGTYNLSENGVLTAPGYEYIGGYPSSGYTGTGIFNQSGGTNIAGTLQIGNTGTGAYYLTGGTLAVTGSLTIGTLGGTGVLSIANVTATAGSVSNGAGRISLVGPSGSNVAGDLTITGDYTQLSSGELDVALGGTIAGSQYTVLDVGGTAALDGTLDVSLANGFVPSPGESFEIIEAGSLAGRFADVILPEGEPYRVRYTPDGVFVTAIPEPGSLTLLGAGTAGLLMRRRRK